MIDWKLFLENAVARIPNLNRRSYEEIFKILKDSGFIESKITDNGWQTFKHLDGSKIDLNIKTGRIVRTAAPKYENTSKGIVRINKGQRISYNGEEIPRNISYSQHPQEIMNI